MRWLGLVVIFLSLFSIPLHAQDETEAPEDQRVPFQTMMGTSEKPTIEGGWINQAKKDQPISKTNPSIHQKKNATVISDELSSDKSIKTLLLAAAEQHKLSFVLQRAEQLKLPATVALIPMIESRYQTHAVSIKGAMGAWQLMPETAKDYGLNPQRSFEFTASTDAALQLLKHLHQQFNSWTLAFAAYNAGSRRVLSALQQNPKARCVEALSLPQETRQYIRRLKQLYQSIAHLSASFCDTSSIQSAV